MTAGAFAIAAAWVPFAGRADAPAGAEQGLSRELGTVTVVWRRLTSLPAQIPTTIEGISGADIHVRINATDAEDALKYFPSLLVRKRYSVEAAIFAYALLVSSVWFARAVLWTHPDAAAVPYTLAAVSLLVAEAAPGVETCRLMLGLSTDSHTM